MNTTRKNTPTMGTFSLDLGIISATTNMKTTCERTRVTDIPNRSPESAGKMNVSVNMKAITPVGTIKFTL